MKTHFQVDIQSEIGKLEGVILHTPGSEVENMTPANAERALYSDILNLVIAQKEYAQLKAVLEKLTNVFQVRNLMEDILEIDKARAYLLKDICSESKNCQMQAELNEMDSAALATLLIEGVPMKKDNLSKFLNPERYELPPLHNFFFTRDSSMTLGNEVLIGSMANSVRDRESKIMEAIFKFHPVVKSPIIKASEGLNKYGQINIEGGDIQVARHDILLSGIGLRTSPGGIDFLIDHLKKQGTKKNIIVQELPHKPESFIHLDMAFTFLSQHECLVYEPLILQPNKYQTIQIEVDNGKVKIKQEKNIVQALGNLGMDVKPIVCGGQADQYTQEREQWHSGANFFTFEPGKSIGYARNVHTLEELSKNGYEIIQANDIISGDKHPDSYDKCIVAIDGSELARGGGGARCMTMPIKRSLP